MARRKRKNRKGGLFILLAILIWVGIYYFPKKHIRFDSQGQIIVNKKIMALSNNELKFSADEDLLYYYFECAPNALKRDEEIIVHNNWIQTIRLDKEAGLLIVSAKQPLVFDVILNPKNVVISPNNPRSKYDKIVVLDAGHGGEDTGAVVNGILEKDINLAIAQKVYERIENGNSGIKAYFVHQSDRTVSLVDRSGYGNDFADLFVSIHNNAFPDSQLPHGTETYYDELMTGENGRVKISGEQLANIMQSNLTKTLGSRDRGVMGDRGFSVLVSSDLPAVLLEIGYMTNPDELQKLSSDSYQEKAADAIYNGILQAFHISQ